MTQSIGISHKPHSPGFVDELNKAVRANPIAAGLIGMGALWMFFGGAKSPAFGSALAGAKDATGAVGAGAGAITRAVGHGIAATGARAGGVARGVGDSITKAAQGAGEVAREMMTSGVDALNSTSHEAAQAVAVDADVPASESVGHGFSTTIQKALAATLERQPLVLGVIGIAIGAGIAGTFASTQTEDEFMGDTAVTLKEGVRSFVSEGVNIAGEAAETMKHEATMQDLSPSALTGQAKDIGDKLKVVAAAARDSIKERVS